MQQERLEGVRQEDVEDSRQLHADTEAIDSNGSAESESEAEDQSWFWTPEWQSEEAEASQEIERSQLSKPLRSVDEIRQHLSQL